VTPWGIEPVTFWLVAQCLENMKWLLIWTL